VRTVFADSLISLTDRPKASKMGLRSLELNILKREDAIKTKTRMERYLIMRGKV
jgi:hypothetical protein